MENLPDPLASDRSIARQVVAYALASARAAGVKLSVETINLYERYADGALTPKQLREALAKLHHLPAPPSKPGRLTGLL